MLPTWLFFALAFAYSHQGIPTPEDQASIQRQLTLDFESDRKAAIQLNELAGLIRSDADAVALVDGIADIFVHELPPTFGTQDLRRRIAHAEHAAASDPLRRIPEQRIADVWNEYVRTIGAQEEAVITVPEIHNMRDATYASVQLAWERGGQSIWTMPNIFEVDADGKIADGCRAVEALRIIYDVDRKFDNLRSARARLQKGTVLSDEIRKLRETTNASKKTIYRLEARVTTNPVRSAERDYIGQHGSEAFNQLLQKSLDQLFPA